MGTANEYEEAAADALSELWSARSRFPDFHSAHEGYAVVLEELDELWDEVRTRDERRDMPRMRREAIQVAAMAIRFAVDCCGGSHE